MRRRAFDPSAEAHDEDRRRRTAGGFLAEHVPFLEQAFEGRAEAGLGLGGRGEFAGPRFEFGHLREQFRRKVEMVVAFERARAAQGGGARLPVAAVAGEGGLGDQGDRLFGGVGAQPSCPAGARVVPAGLAGEVVGAEALHALHELDGFGGAAFGEEGADAAQRFAQELRGQAREFGLRVRVVGIDADDRTQHRQRAVFVASADRVAVVAVERMAFADDPAVEAFDREHVLAVEREAGRQAAFAAERMPAVGLREAQQGAEAEEVGVGFGGLECGVFVAAAHQRGALFEAFAGPQAQRRVFAGQRTSLEIRRPEFELAADAGDEAFGLHGSTEFEQAGPGGAVGIHGLHHPGGAGFDQLAFLE